MTCTQKDSVKYASTELVVAECREAADNWGGGFVDIDWIKRRP